MVVTPFACKMQISTAKTFGAVLALRLLALVGSLVLSTASAFAADEKTGEHACLITQTSLADFYAILYDDGRLVFQANAASDASSTATYEGSLAGYSSAQKVPWLQNAVAIKSVRFDDSFRALQPRSLKCWFYGCSQMSEIDLTNLDASKSTTMQKMFMGCSSLSRIDGLDQMDTSSSTYFESMFNGCSSLKSLDISHFDATHVEVLCFMFNGCSSLEKLNMHGEGWRTSSLGLMVHVWEGCTSLKSLDLSYLDTSGVRSMTHDFGDRQDYEACEEARARMLQRRLEVEGRESAEAEKARLSRHLQEIKQRTHSQDSLDALCADEPNVARNTHPSRQCHCNQLAAS